MIGGQHDAGDESARRRDESFSVKQGKPTMSDYAHEYRQYAEWEDADRAARAIADRTGAPAGVARTMYFDGVRTHVGYDALSWDAMLDQQTPGEWVTGFRWAGAETLTDDDYWQRQRELLELLSAQQSRDQRAISAALDNQTIGAMSREAARS